MIDTKPAWPDEGENDSDNPGGTPVAERLTDEGLPPDRSTDTTALPFPPCVTVFELGVTTSAKLDG